VDTTSPKNPSADASEKWRYISPYSRSEKIKRLLWACVENTFFRWSFPTWYNYRAGLLRLLGAKIGRSSQIRRTVHFECPWNFTCGDHCAIGDRAIMYALGPITIHDRVSISQMSHLCAGTHDFKQKQLPLLRTPIVLKNDAWLGADAFVGPGVTMNEGALLGARGSAFKDLEGWTINVGNPARKVRDRPRIDLM